MIFSESEKVFLLILICITMNKNGRRLISSIISPKTRNGIVKNNYFFKVHYGYSGSLERLTLQNTPPSPNNKVISIFDPTLVFFRPQIESTLDDVLDFRRKFIESICKKSGFDIQWNTTSIVLRKENKKIVEIDEEGRCTFLSSAFSKFIQGVSETRYES